MRFLSVFSRSIALLILLGMALVSGCGGSSESDQHTPMLVFSDVHFNPLDDPALFTALVAADVSQWEGIFKSSKKPPSSFGTNTNYALLALAMASIQQNVGASPLVIYTGDILSHSLAQTFYTYQNGTTTAGDGADAPANEAAMKVFIGKTLAFFIGQLRAAVGHVPVLFALGNADSYIGYGPDSRFFADNAELFYADFLKGTANRQDFMNSFKAGGYYLAEPLGQNLVVIGLNTLVFSTQLTTNSDDAVATELAWLDSQLAAAKAANKKAWLVMHVPPGADAGTSSRSVDNNWHLSSSSAAMMWKPAYQTSFLQVLAKYPSTVTTMLAGHTHMDDYRIVTANQVLEISPGISPVFNNNPAYKVYAYSADTFKALNYRSVNFDLGNGATQFKPYYSFADAYGLTQPLNLSLRQLYSDLGSNKAYQTQFRTAYYSDHSALNAISNASWPIYRCAGGNLLQQDFINCVNAAN